MRTLQHGPSLRRSLAFSEANPPERRAGVIRPKLCFIIVLLIVRVLVHQLI
jgi:hypothetical protein